MEDLQTWQELLRQIISDQLEHSRIAKEMAVNPITLTRWSNRTSVPRLGNLRQLLEALSPYHRQKMLPLLQKDFPKFSPESPPEEEITTEIPAIFYANIMNVYTTSPPLLRSSAICITIFQQMLRHLDPLKLGLKVVVCLCMPPTEGEKVHSLYMSQGRATRPWESVIDNEIGFLGLESQVGSVVSKSHPIIMQSRKERMQFYPSDVLLYAESVAAYPLQYFDSIAGAMCVMSTQQNHFTPTRIQLMHSYAELFVLAFTEEQFYPLKEIDLCVMPPRSVQEPYLEKFHVEITARMLEAEKNSQQLKRSEAELQVWKGLEVKFLDFAEVSREKILTPTIPKLPTSRDTEVSPILSPDEGILNIESTAFSYTVKEEEGKEAFALKAMLRAEIEEDKYVLVDKDYSLQAGITRTELSKFTSASDKKISLESNKRLIFNISLHNSNNVELTTEWEKDLYYFPDSDQPQFTDFSFKFISEGPGTITVDFYYARHWLKTLRCEFLARVSPLSTTQLRGIF
jgi:hypothetical protein